jgi:uncharacterized protein (UPF0262 family)
LVQRSSPPDDNEARRAASREQCDRLAEVILEEQAGVRLSPMVEHERKVALYDLIEENRFTLKGVNRGPYILYLGNTGERLIFTVCDEMELQVTRFSLPQAVLRRIIKDYFIVCENYFDAIKNLTPVQIEAIDMGRRGLHNDGAELLRDALADKVDIDKNTARRLFTLICVLHIRR